MYRGQPKTMNPECEARALSRGPRPPIHLLAHGQRFKMDLDSWFGLPSLDTRVALDPCCILRSWRRNLVALEQTSSEQPCWRLVTPKGLRAWGFEPRA